MSGGTEALRPVVSTLGVQLCEAVCRLNSPVKIWIKPKRMMMMRASNLEAVNKSWTLVAALTLIQFTNVREAEQDTTEIRLRNYGNNHL